MSKISQNTVVNFLENVVYTWKWNVSDEAKHIHSNSKFL